MRKRKLKYFLYPLIAVPFFAIATLVGIVKGDWLTVVVDSSWEIGHRTLFNVVFDYLEGDNKTFSNLEKSAKLDLPSFNDDRYDCEWTIGSHSYSSGVISIQTLYQENTALVTSEVSPNGKVTTYTIILSEARTGLKTGYFEVLISNWRDVSSPSTNHTFTTPYSLITKVAPTFLVFNISPTVENYYLDHFVYDLGGASEQSIGLNSSLLLTTTDAGKINSDKQLILTAFFKAA